MTIPCELLQTKLDLDHLPRRIVSLNSGYTEALFAMGWGHFVVGVSTYCPRYADCAHLPIVGSYLTADTDLLVELEPDLVLMTSGIQLNLARKLTVAGFPVMAIPLPGSAAAVCDGFMQIAALCGDVAVGRRLADRMLHDLLNLRAGFDAPNPSIYAEVWFGSHARMVGGVTFMNDIMWYAGAEPIFGGEPWAYAPLDLDRAAALKPQVFLGFYEPELCVDFPALSSQRGWREDFWPKVIVSDITKGQNIIHDGPSMTDTARWLQTELVNSLTDQP